MRRLRLEREYRPIGTFAKIHDFTETAIGTKPAGIIVILIDVIVIMAFPVRRPPPSIEPM